MTRQPARVLEPSDLQRLLVHASELTHGTRNRVIVLASFKAGLRACEISGLTWPMALKSSGQIAEQLTIARGIAKYGSGRIIPLHNDLRRALRDLHRECARPADGPIICSAKGGAMAPQSLVNWFRARYAELGITGASSHSGRRTFITQSARAITKVGGSLRDVQELAGHRALTTTERYIQGDRDAQRKLIKLI
ncbi:tyrosine-type recombinase/integrase [Aurantiacibacter luteus]|uniref:Integrase n=1 Tax=Aurantiacibacter luteus TaxID=1581420 RepID=A0A0G9MSV2_9SPHN|nr:site-specific integrase [Aurantiacibacter luteus]KLE32398.1 integrase [Aurantiacibacter luteus]